MIITPSNRGGRFWITAVFFICAFSSLNTHAYYNTRSPMGTNTNEVLEFDSSMPFLDLFKASLPFREAAPFLTKGRVDYDRYGWPKYISAGGQAGTRLISKIHENAIPRGYYTVLYDGNGKLEYGLDAKLIQSQKGRDVIMLDPGKDKLYNAKITIKSTNPRNHLRNIRVLPQGGICSSNPFVRVHRATQCGKKDFLDFERHYEKIIFNPDYLKFMRDYKVVRFMNMGGITRNPIQHWADRNHIKQATWGGAEGVRGAPLEIMVELANRLNADAWFSIPHAASNDFVLRFAQHLKKHLNPNLKVYVEYSNETWNGIFTQHAYMKQQGMRQRLDDVSHVAGWKFYSKRSVEIFKMFERVFGGKQRLIRVMAGLTGNTEMTDTMLSFNNNYLNADAFAVAPYVFGETKALRRARSVQQVFQIMQDKRYHHSLPRVLEAIRRQAVLTRKYGVDLVAYEGGQHLIDDKTKKDTQHPNPLFYQANRHPQMKVIYQRLFQGWKQAGGKMFVHFSSPRQYNRFGSKGTKEYITQPDHEAPKHLAIKSFIRSNPCWWSGCAGSSLVRHQKPRARTKAELATLSGDVPLPLPNSKEDRARNARIAAANANRNRRQPQAAPARRNNTVAGIPNLEPVSPVSSQRSQPILVALSRPPRERYVFGNKAVSSFAQNPAVPLDRASSYQLRRVVFGKIDGSRDLAAVWQSSWDNKNLYLRIAVSDDALIRDSQHSWQDDSIEIFIDGDASRGSSYDRYNDIHLMYRWRDRTLRLGKNSTMLAMGHKSEHIHGRYVLNLTIPWTSLKVRPRKGHRIGLDIHVNDDDNGGKREGKLTWFGRTDEAYRNPSAFGELVLTE